MGTRRTSKRFSRNLLSAGERIQISLQVIYNNKGRASFHEILD